MCVCTCPCVCEVSCFCVRLSEGMKMLEWRSGMHTVIFVELGLCQHKYVMLTDGSVEDNQYLDRLMDGNFDIQ